jgi:hypothetical protein
LAFVACASSSDTTSDALEGVELRALDPGLVRERRGIGRAYFS